MSRYLRCCYNGVWQQEMIQGLNIKTPPCWGVSSTESKLPSLHRSVYRTGLWHQETRKHCNLKPCCVFRHAVGVVHFSSLGKKNSYCLAPTLLLCCQRAPWEMQELCMSTTWGGLRKYRRSTTWKTALIVTNHKNNRITKNCLQCDSNLLPLTHSPSLL